MIISDNHFFLSSSHEIDELSKPLKQLDITYFQYAKHTADGGRIWLTNTPKIVTTYYEKNFHLSGNTESHPDKYKPAVLLWSTLPKQYLYDHCADLGIYDGMFIVSPCEDGSCEFYGYGTNKRDKNIINIYLSHLDIIKKYISISRKVPRN